MVGMTHIQELTVLVQTMKDQGILGDRIETLLRLQDEENALFVLELIFNFYCDADVAIPQLNRLLNEEVVDYTRVANYILLIKGGCSGVDGVRMGHLCQELRRHCNERDKERCLALLEGVRQEYNTLRGCLDNVAQIVRNILISGVGFRRD